MAVQKLDAIDGMNQRQNRHFFTSYPEMNEVLNRFAAEADADEIWISAEVRDMQEQTLIKIQYSCEDRMLREFDKAIVKMRDLIESVGGYLKLQLDGDTGSIKIAIPDN